MNALTRYCTIGHMFIDLKDNTVETCCFSLIKVTIWTVTVAHVLKSVNVMPLPDECFVWQSRIRVSLASQTGAMLLTLYYGPAFTELSVCIVG